jgi:NAD(P)-dependent dehydrogenase (short-subunit alcohol dehydrogenase family)
VSVTGNRHGPHSSELNQSTIQIHMLLKNKNIVIYGASGAIGSAMARAFALAGAKVFLTGRSRAALTKLVDEIFSAGGERAEADPVDALDEAAIDAHLTRVVERVGSIDVSFNAIGIPQTGIQGIPLAELPVDSFSLPIATYTRSHFLTARAAARHMLSKRSGVLMMHTPEPARLGVPLIGGMGLAWAAMEALTRNLSAEFGPHGVRAICLRSTGIPETATITTVFGLHAKAIGMTREQFQGLMESMSHTRRSTTLKELTDVAVFMASDLATGMAGTVVNLTAGKVVD